MRIVRAYALPTVQCSLVWRSLLHVHTEFDVARTARGSSRCGAGYHPPPIFQLPSTWIVARWRHAPSVLEVLDLWPEFAIGMGILKNRLLIRVSLAVEWFFYRTAKHLVVNSPAYRDYLIAGQIEPSDVTFIPMGIDPDLFEADQHGEDIRKQFGLENRFVVTYACALGLANDLDTVIGAAELLRHDEDVHFFLAGGGKERNRLEAEVQTLQLPNVTFGGIFPKERVRDVLAASDACVATLRNIPEFRTPFPNKVFDYMAAEKPVSSRHRRCDS